MVLKRISIRLLRVRYLVVIIQFVSPDVSDVKNKQQLLSPLNV